MRSQSLSLSISRSITPVHRQHGWRLFIATALVAVAGGLSQTAWAASGGGMGLMGAMGTMGPGGHGGHGAHGARRIERLLDSVNATPEQRQQILQLVQAARADGAGQRDAQRKLREQGQALFAQPTVDARAVETLRQQMLAQHDQTSRRMAQLMIDVSRVLTPEQRKTVAERMAQRRAMTERHRSERDAAQGQPPR